jgi:hypothetical protein
MATSIDNMGLDKENRKQGEMDSIQQLRVDTARGWSAEQAVDRAERDLNYLNVLDKNDAKYEADSLRSDMAINARENSAYRNAVEAAQSFNNSAKQPNEAQAQAVADFIASNINRTPEKVAQNVEVASPELKSVLSDADKMKAIEKDVNRLLDGINRVYVAETKAVIAQAAGRDDAKAATQQVEAISDELPHLREIRQSKLDSEDALKVANFIGANVNRTPEKVAENTRYASPELKAILADNEKMTRIEPQVDKLLVGISQKYVADTKSVIAASLTQPAQARGGEKAEPVLTAAPVVPGAAAPPVPMAPAARNTDASAPVSPVRAGREATGPALDKDTVLVTPPRWAAPSAQVSDIPRQDVNAELDVIERKRKEAILAAAGEQQNTVDVQRKGGELDRGEFILPRRVAQAYTELDGKFYAKDTDRMMFHDQGEKLATSTTDKVAVADMVAYAKAKQWESLKLTGSQEFRREAWLQAESQGIKTQGFTPREKDLVELKALTLERSTNSITPLQDRAKDRAQLEKPITAPRHDLNKNQAATATAVAQNNTTNIKELQKDPAMERFSMEELSKIAFYRALLVDREKDSAPAVRDEAVAKFDTAMRNPEMVKALPDPELKAETQAAARDKEHKRDTSELSL